MKVHSLIKDRTKRRFVAESAGDAQRLMEREGVNIILSQHSNAGGWEFGSKITTDSEFERLYNSIYRLWDSVYSAEWYEHGNKLYIVIRHDSK